MGKRQQIIYCLSKVQQMLDYLDPDKKWRIIYESNMNYRGSECFSIYNNDNVKLYSVDVTGDSVLTAIEELMRMLARKF